MSAQAVPASPAIASTATPLLDGMPVDETRFVPPGKLTRLAPSARSSYADRLLAGVPHIAELFHANSRLVPGGRRNVLLDPRELEHVRRWFFASACQPREREWDFAAARRHGVLADLDDLEASTGLPLRKVLGDGIAKSVYALDLLVVSGDAVRRVLPGDARMWLELPLGAEQRIALRRALPAAGWPPNSAPPLLVLVGFPWRYMMLQGPRGYRRTLLDAGRVLATIEAAASAAGRPPLTVHYDFYDGALERALGLDGVERVPLAVVELAGPGGDDDHR